MSVAALALIVVVAVIIGTATLLVMQGRRADAAQRELGGTRGASSFTTGVVIVATCLVLIVLLSAGYTTYAVQQSQHKWCTTLDLLTAHPVPKPADPQANPSRQQNYLYYTTFLSLKDGFGCS